MYPMPVDRQGEAIQWLNTLKTAGPKEWRAFGDWLCASSANARAFADMAMTEALLIRYVEALPERIARRKSRCVARFVWLPLRWFRRLRQRAGFGCDDR